MNRNSCVVCLIAIYVFLFSAQNALAGGVDFQLFFEPNSAWDGNYTARAAMESMFGQYEATLRTSGAWNATIEVYVTDNESSAFASASAGSSAIVDFDGKKFLAPNAWQQIVQGEDDPNGPIQPDGSGRDIVVNWNLALSQPASNIGLLRHELMHGLGMTSSLPRPSMAIGGAITRPLVGQETIARIADAALRDLNGNPLLADYNGAYDRHVLADYAVDSDWGDANESGIFFRGIADDGSPLDMTMNSWQATESSTGRVDFSHITDVSYFFARNGEWNFVNASDRAFFRGLGYESVAPTTRLADYDHDSKVDGGDFLLWQRSLGDTSNLAADGNGNGVVDGADLSVWKVDFGSSDDHGHTSALATPMSAPGAAGGVISSPGDDDWFSFSAVAGNNYSFSAFAGSLLNPDLELFDPDGITPIVFGSQWQPSVSDDYFLRVAGQTATEMGSYGLSILEIEPDDHANNPSNATNVSVPSSTAGTIGVGDDQDWISFTAEMGQDYQLETSLDTLSDTILALYDTDGTTRLAINDDIDFSAGNLASRIDWTAPTAGVYYALVTSYSTRTGDYTLHITTPPPVFAVPEPTTAWLICLAGMLSSGRRQHQ